MFADVAIKEPIEALTYRIPSEVLISASIGSLISVPFRGKKVYGVIIGIHKKIKPELKDKKIFPIYKIVCSNWAGDPEIKLAKIISQYSQTSFGIAIFRLMPIVSKKLVVSPGLKVQHTYHANRYHLFLGIAERVDQYVKLFNQLQPDQQALIVAPQNTISKIKANLQLNKISFGTVDSTTKTSHDLKIYKELQLGKIQILLGTRKIVGWPGKNLKFIIIDDPINFSHFDEREPYLDSTTIAIFRKKIGINLILGFPIYTPELYFSQKLGEAKKIRALKKENYIEIVDLKQGLISSRLRELILAQEIIYIICPRKGQGGVMRCTDCDNLVRCPKCEATIFFGADGGICNECDEKVFAISCSICHGHSIQSLGIGLDQIKKHIEKEFPEQIKNIVFLTEGDIDNIPPTAYVVFSFADAPLSSPHLLRPYRFLSIIKDLSSERHIVVQTKNTTSAWWRVLAGDKETLEHILKERQKFKLPPFAKIYNLINPSSKIIENIKKSGFETQLENDILRISIPADKNLDLGYLKSVKVKSPSLI